MKIKGLLRRTSHDPEVQYVEHNAIFYNIQSVFPITNLQTHILHTQ